MADLNYLTCTSEPSNLLGVFAKYWEPGAAKTRLAATIGSVAAARISQVFVETTLSRLHDCAKAFIIGFDPPEREAEFTALACRQWGVWPQPKGDLGVRMRTFFELALRSIQPVVLIGSDSPDLPVAYVEQAFAALDRYNVVLGPTRDAGYYLIGIAGKVPPIFDGIPWSTDGVWQATVDRLDQGHTRWQRLPEWCDVDDEQGLHDLLVRLDTARQDDPHLARLHDQLTGLLSGGPAV